MIFRADTPAMPSNLIQRDITSTAFRLVHTGPADLDAVDHATSSFLNKKAARSFLFILVGLSEINSKNYRIILDNVNKSNSTPVKQPVDPTITDLSYDPNSIVKTIKQQQKHEFSKKEIEGIIAAYQSGASTYELAKQYNCHRSTISHQLKHDIEVKIER